MPLPKPCSACLLLRHWNGGGCGALPSIDPALESRPARPHPSAAAPQNQILPRRNRQQTPVIPDSTPSPSLLLLLFLSFFYTSSRYFIYIHPTHSIHSTNPPPNIFTAPRRAGARGCCGSWPPGPALVPAAAGSRPAGLGATAGVGVFVCLFVCLVFVGVALHVNTPIHVSRHHHHPHHPTSSSSSSSHKLHRTAPTSTE